ncbi:hypothetical protein [Herbaspirillum sp. RV1423]|uniref:hypothetical protein n=1 Tax=Herbaspirillum sp. RV1423 TaxID=1443993 RepID=UPI0004B96243|nr:hypothetical protein [Herbaspirillum sp. RV1423]
MAATGAAAGLGAGQAIGDMTATNAAQEAVDAVATGLKVAKSGRTTSKNDLAGG